MPGADEQKQQQEQQHQNTPPPPPPTVMNDDDDDYAFEPDELVLNYYDACLYGRDLDLFESPSGWLNDACLHFVLTDLQQQEQEQQGTTDQQANNATAGTTTLFLDPAVISFLMHQCHDEDDFQDFCRGCRNFEDNIYRLVVPINDSLTAPQQLAGAGTHWSLLVLEREQQQQSHQNKTTNGNDDDDDDDNNNVIKGYHFDSFVSSGNLNVAQAVADKILQASRCTAFAVSQTKQNTSSSSSSSSSCNVEQCRRVPLQQNGYDCGVHVIAAAQAVANIHNNHHNNNNNRNPLTSYQDALWEQIGNDSSSSFCQKLRKKCAKRIRTLASS